MNRETRQHAQVSATLVPQLIKDLAEPGETSDAAFFHLTETLVVAGTWLPTSAPAAELLLALLNRPDTEPVPCALRLLADVAAAGHLWFFTPAAPEQRKRDAVGQHTLALAQRALPLARTWLTSPNAELRAAAVFFLALVEEDAASAPLVAALPRTETLPELRAGAALALGLYARAGNAGSRHLLSELSTDRYVQAGMWAGRVIAGLPYSEQETTTGVGAWFNDWRPSLLPWGYTRPREVVMAALQLVPSYQALAPALIRSTAQNPSAIVCKIGVELAGFTTSFAESEVVPVAALSPLQRATAEALTAIPGAMLGLSHGLPGCNQTAERWLGLAPPGPLEQLEVNGLMRWQRVRALYAAAEPPTAETIIAESLKDLSAAAQLEVATELLLGAYRILIQIDATISPSDLAKLALAAGDEGVRWAQKLVGAAIGPYAEAQRVALLAPSHWMMIFGVLVDAGVPLATGCEHLIVVDASAESRKVLAALPALRREQVVQERIKRLEGRPDIIKARFLDQLAQVLHIVASPAVLSALRAVLESGRVGARVAAETAARLRAPMVQP